MSKFHFTLRDVKNQFAKIGFVWLVIGIGAAVAAFKVSQPLMVAHLAAKEISTIPYTLKLETYRFQQGREGQLIQSRTVARRSDGATVIQENLFGRPGLALGSVGRKVIFPDGRIFTIIDSVKTGTKWPEVSQERLAAFKTQRFNPPADCVRKGETFAGRTTILGRDVTMVYLPMVGSDRITHWRANNFLCESLQSRIESSQPDGSFSLLSESRPVSLVIGEPDPSLFEIESTYQYGKPSEALRKEAARVGLTWTSELEGSVQKADNQLTSK